jgi:hypothetical protein
MQNVTITTATVIAPIKVGGGTNLVSKLSILMLFC